MRDDDTPCRNCGEPVAVHDDGDCPDGVSAGYLPQDWLES